MSNFSRTKSSSNERLNNQQNETTIRSTTTESIASSTTSITNSQQSIIDKKNQSRLATPQLNLSPQSSAKSNISSQSNLSIQSQSNTFNQSNRLNPKSNQTYKMQSISPTLSSANSNQSSAASSINSSVNSLIDNQEELTNLTNFVKNFREQLSELRRIVTNEMNQRKDDELIETQMNQTMIRHQKSDQTTRETTTKEMETKDLSKEMIDRQEMFKAQVHDKLADVLRILRIIFERFVQSPDLFVCSKNLIETVKG